MHTLQTNRLVRLMTERELERGPYRVSFHSRSMHESCMDGYIRHWPKNVYCTRLQKMHWLISPPCFSVSAAPSLNRDRSPWTFLLVSILTSIAVRCWLTDHSQMLYTCIIWEATPILHHSSVWWSCSCVWLNCSALHESSLPDWYEIYMYMTQPILGMISMFVCKYTVFIVLNTCNVIVGLQ